MRLAANPRAANLVGLVRLALWIAALFCGQHGFWQVFAPNKITGQWGAMIAVPVERALPYWGAALVFGALAVLVGTRQTATAVPRAASTESKTQWRWIAAAVLPLIGAYALQTDREFTLLGLLSWAAGLAMLYTGLVPQRARPLRNGVVSVITFPRRRPVTALALAAIVALGVVVRSLQLPTIPPELVPDQIENLLSVQQILDGRRDIYFANNGGRESLHFYLSALVTPLTGGANFSTLKLTAVFESIVGILAFYGLGVEIAGGRSRRARYFGLMLALAGAAGTWYVVLTRMTLRPLLMPPLTALVLWALIRLIRHNRRQDAVVAGLLLGVGLYSYQAMRVAPALAIIACGIGILWTRREAQVRRRYLAHLIVAGVMAVAVCLPLVRYVAHDSAAFWFRYNAIVLGAETGCIDGGTGRCAEDNPVQVLAGNLWRTLLMFPYRGDTFVVYNAPGYPVVDPAGVALLLAGAGAGAVMIARRRDPVAVFLALSFATMLLPGVFTFARLDEVPNSIRTTGAMPVLYATIAFGLVGTVYAAVTSVPARLRSLVRIGVPVLVAVSMASHAWTVVSTAYASANQGLAVSTAEVGQHMRAFADEVGTWGNVYLVHYPHHLDYRAVMIQAGLPPGHFPNNNVLLADIPAWLYSNSQDSGLSRYDPDRDILFVLSYESISGLRSLVNWFPEGKVEPLWTRVGTRYESSEPVVTFRVPALGQQGFLDFLRAQNVVITE